MFDFIKRLFKRSEDPREQFIRDNFSGYLDAFGEGVSKRNAVKISTVYTCLNILGETFGSLPFEVKQDTDKGRITRKDSPVYRLIHDRPNPAMTAFHFWFSMVFYIKAWGNAFAIIKRNDFQQPEALLPVHPSDVKMYLTADNEVIYDINGKRYMGIDVLHFKGFTIDGYWGLSAIDENRLTISHAKKLREYNKKLVGERPPGYLTAQMPPADKASKENIIKMWSNPERVSGVPLLYGGVEYKSLSLPADAVAYIESVELNEQDIYGIFRIPPTLAQNYKRATFSNAEQQDLVFSKYSLAMRVSIEQECNAKLFPEENFNMRNPLYTKFNLKGILAGDINSRQQFYRTMLTLGVFSPNQVLELEDMPTYEGGDRKFIQGAMMPVDLIDSFWSRQTKNKSEVNGYFKDLNELIQ